VRIAAVLLLPLLIAVLVLAVSRKEVSSAPPSVKTKPRSVVWADRVFTEPRPFAFWLRSRDKSYAVWARKHQRAALILRQ